jgi:hypothetical protein
MIGSGRDTMTGLAAGLSATEDRELLTQLNADTAFGFSPTFEVTSEGSMKASNAGAMLEALHNFEDNLFGFDDSLDPSGDGIDETLFSKDDPIFLAVQAAGGVPWPTPWTEPDDWSLSSDAGQISAGQTLSGFEGGIFAESLQGLGVAGTVAGKNVRKEAFKAVIAAAFEPGTLRNKAVVRKLLDQSIKLAALAEKRAAVTQRARDAFQANLKQVTELDGQIARLFPKVFDPQGKLRPTASDADLKLLLELRKKNVDLGRKTVRLQKLNMLASALTHNTLTQVVTVQNMAQAVAAGAPQALPALGLAFDKLGRESTKIKAMREKQRENWNDKAKIKNARDGAGLGLEGFDCLYGFDVIELPFDQMEHELAALDFSFKKAFRKFKRTAKSIGREVGKATKTLVKAAIITPAKGTILAAKKIAKGDVKGAFKAVGQSVVSQAKGIKDFAAQTVLKWGCDIANTKAFKAGVQAVGQAVGTVVGGIYAQPTVGGAVGTEAGAQVANLQRNTCGAMKTIGLTDGKFRPGKIDNAAKDFAKRAWKETFSPQAHLRSLKNIAMNAAGGQFSSAFKVGGVDVMSKVGLDPNKLVTNNPALQNLYRQGTQKLQGKLQAGFQKGAGSLLKKAGVPYASSLVSIAQSGQMPDYKSLIKNVNVKALTEQGAQLAKKQAIAIARRQVGKTVTRVVPGLNIARSSAGTLRANASAAELMRIRAELSPASVQNAQGPLPMLSKYVSQPTEDALPYVGSIGRDF